MKPEEYKKLFQEVRDLIQQQGNQFSWYDYKHQILVDGTVRKVLVGDKWIDGIVRTTRYAAHRDEPTITHITELGARIVGSRRRRFNKAFGEDSLNQIKTQGIRRPSNNV